MAVNNETQTSPSILRQAEPISNSTQSESLIQDTRLTSFSASSHSKPSTDWSLPKRDDLASLTLSWQKNGNVNINLEGLPTDAPVNMLYIPNIKTLPETPQEGPSLKCHTLTPKDDIISSLSENTSSSTIFAVNRQEGTHQTFIILTSADNPHAIAKTSSVEGVAHQRRVSLNTGNDRVVAQSPRLDTSAEISSHPLSIEYFTPLQRIIKNHPKIGGPTLPEGANVSSAHIPSYQINPQDLLTEFHATMDQASHLIRPEASFIFSSALEKALAIIPT